MSIYGPRSIGTAEDFGLDPDGGRWVVTCTAHATVVNVPTRREAREIRTTDFCERCIESEWEPEDYYEQWQVGPTGNAVAMAEFQLSQMFGE